MCACAGQFVAWAGTAKMATSNSLDKVLISNREPGRVTALLGAVDGPLTAPSKSLLNNDVGVGVHAGSVIEARRKSEASSKKLEVVRVPANKIVCSGVVQSGGGGGPISSQISGGTQGVSGVEQVTLVGGAGAQVNASNNNNGGGSSVVYGVSPTPMTGGQGATVNGGVPVGGTAVSGVSANVVVKGLNKVIGGSAVAQSAVIMSKPGTVTAAVPSTVTPGTVPTLPQGPMQIINMRPGAIKTSQGTPIGSRMILSPAQVLPNVRQGQPGLTLGTLQGLPPGAQGHLLVKTENGQLQLLRVNTAAPPGQIAGTTVTTTALQPAPNTAYRFQQPQGGTVAVRSVMVSSAAPPRPNTIILQSQASNTPVLSTATTTTTVATQAVVSTGTATSIPTAAGTTVAGTIITPTTLTTATPTTQTPQPTTSTTTTTTTAGQTITAESAKTKCKNFLATLLKLANEQRAPVARNVRNLIQGLIEGRVEPEAFTEELQKDLNSSPQPCLVPFLKKTLPYLRVSLARGELTIDGVRPPPLSAVTPVTGVTTVIPTMSITRPGAPVAAGTVRMVQPAAVNATTVVQRPATVTPSPARVVTHQQVQQMRVQAGKTVVTTVRQNTPTPATTAPTTTTTTTTVPTVTKAVTVNKAIPTKDKDKSKDKVFTFRSSYSSSGVTDDDINDVAAMGGVNLGEESQRILDSTGFVGTQIRSCKDENFLLSTPLTQRIRQICTKYDLEDVPKDVVALVSHATQERLKTIVEKLAVISEHRLDIIKSDNRYEVHQDVKGQLRFLEELDKLEKKRKDEQEREMLLRAAKSRSKSEDPEQAKLKAKAKEMQRVEMEEMRQRDANRTALNALQGPKKKPKLDLSTADDGATFSGTFSQKSIPLRPRIKRVNMRDLMFLMEQEKELNKSLLLYRSYLK